VDSETVADAMLVVSELVTNALVHGEEEIELRLERDGDTLRGQVIDGGGGFEAEVRERGMHEVGGRGLLVVGAVTDRWGVFEGSSHVWFEMHARSTASEIVEPQLGDPPQEVP
jgi:anti-sigma regulatory factor (Ser/Thr protein kinase)